MPQPTLLKASGRLVAKFGNLPLPNGQGTLANIDLNDGVFCKLGDYNSDDANRMIGLAQLLYRGRAVYTSDDWGPRDIELPITYIEDATHFLGAFLASLSQAGEQQLTFDNLTYILAKYKGVSGRKAANRRIPFGWKFNLQLIARTPWFQDLAATSSTPVNPVTVDAGSAFAIVYAGSIWCEPVWTLHVPVTNTVVINSMQLKNTMSGQFLTVNFLSATPIPATTVRDIVIDCAASTAVCTQTGESYDVTGSFPMLFPPAGQSNAFTLILTPASGSTTGVTLAQTHYPRWQI